ncbi:MAG TPA: methyltransferase domain-containing protein, partial [Longimicrobium sp.]|nr:methyltransferase domain-containing protein [Longimicrobium sp.]
MIRRTLRRLVPRALRMRLRAARQRAIGRRWRGAGVHCPVCGGDFTRFLPFGEVVRREHAQCPGCGAVERHRLIWRFLHERTELFSRPHRMLHFAPEPWMEPRLRRAPTIDYLSVDLDPGNAMRVADITALPFADGSFDAVLCVDVLEHIDEDARAMRELHRVLRPGGWALLRVPIDFARAATLQDPAIRSREDRAREYWHWDHRRL